MCRLPSRQPPPCRNTTTGTGAPASAGRYRSSSRGRAPGSAAYGTPLDSLVAFPDPHVLAAAGPDAIRAVTGVTGARARTVHALAAALADGLDLDAAATAAGPAQEAHAELLALPGIGPWTADYVALRVFGDSDAFLPSDLVLRRALGNVPAREAAARAQAWRPWRGYALLHLWTHEVFG